MTLSRMLNAASHLIPQIYSHPFNRELLLGTLPGKKFRFYVEQDALYLHDFAKALRVTSGRFTNPEYAQQFKMFSKEILDTERNLHVKYLGKSGSPRLFGFKKKTIEKIPAVSAYTQHILKTAHNAPIEESVASVLPCFWIYSDLGRKILDMPEYKINNPYHAWVSSYSNFQFTSATKSIIQIAEELGSTITCPVRLEGMITAFVKSTEHELLFWDSAYKKMDEKTFPPQATR